MGDDNKRKKKKVYATLKRHVKTVTFDEENALKQSRMAERAGEDETAHAILPATAEKIKILGRNVFREQIK